jgi:hypothetical protein
MSAAGTVEMFPQLRGTAAEVLLAGAASAHAFLDIAEATRNSARARVEVQHAREALATIERTLTNADLDPELRGAIESVRDRLKARLETKRLRRTLRL